VIFYLTFNDAPSGIFSSQVVDVVKFFNNELQANTKLVSFISLRCFRANRKKIKNELSGAIVLPMFPGVHRWKKNSLLLYLICLWYKPTFIIGRSVIATQLALKLKNISKIEKIIYDGRGAIAAEWKEYGVVNHPKLLKEIFLLEKEAVLNSDYRIAVSNKLVEYWQTEFGYHETHHVVIPCTLNKVFEEVIINTYTVKKARELLGLNQTDTVFIYSGSLAGWQSFNLLYEFIKPILQSSENCKLVFLSEMDKQIANLQLEFKEQVICKKVKPNEVPNYLIAANYGLLIREQSVTNQVASPVKFAEYLACGLKIIISENLGDYSKYVIEHKCGYNFCEFDYTGASTSSIYNDEILYFKKCNYLNEYKMTLSL
jgi:glycosyltransferase involved in cell wall biosynthesis